MKTLIFSILVSLILIPLASAQYSVVVVADPVATSNEAQEIAKWTQSIAVLNQQLQQIQQYVSVAQSVKGYIGDPAAAAQAVQLQLMGSSQLATSVGQLSSTISQTVNTAQTLENSGSNLFTPVQFQTPSGLPMQYAENLFKPFGAIQSQNANVNNVIQNTISRIAALQKQKASALVQMQSAPSQSTVQKLTTEISAIDGQIASLGQQQQTATDQIVTQNIANQNDQQMKAQAANAAADHDLNVSLQNFMNWEGQVSNQPTPFQ